MKKLFHLAPSVLALTLAALLALPRHGGSFQYFAQGALQAGTTTSCGSGSRVAVSWSRVNKDTGGYTNHGLDPTYIGIANQAGWYLICAGVTWDVDTSGIRILDLRVDGSTFIVGGGSQVSATNGARHAVCANYYMAVNDYVEATIFQNSANGTRSVTGGNASFVFQGP